MLYVENWALKHIRKLASLFPLFYLMMRKGSRMLLSLQLQEYCGKDKKEYICKRNDKNMQMICWWKKKDNKKEIIYLFSLFSIFLLLFFLIIFALPEDTWHQKDEEVKRRKEKLGGCHWNEVKKWRKEKKVNKREKGKLKE